MKKLSVLLLTGLLLASTAQMSHAQFFLFNNPLEGEKAPDFTLLNTQGKEMTLSDQIKDKNSLIFFWATWCPHCLEQLKQLKSDYKTLEENNIELVLIDVGEGAGQVQAFLERLELPFNVFLDQDSAVSAEYDLIGVPTFFFVNQEGIILNVVHALPDDYKEAFSE